MLAAILFLVAAPPITHGAVQEPAVEAQEPAAGSQTGDAEALRARIHEMRMNLLLGGDNVRQAETEAVDFYYGKMELVEQRLDDVHADLAEKRASYDVLMQRALEASSPEARRTSLQSAQEIKLELGEFEREAAELRVTRERLSKFASSIEARKSERSRLSVQLETTGSADSGLGWAMGSLGLAPETVAREPASVFDDPAFVADLLARDELGARRILFEADPVRFWEHFPLKPPETALRQALAFPVPDLPGRR